MILPKGSTLTYNAAGLGACLDISFTITRKTLPATNHGTTGMWETSALSFKRMEMTVKLYFLPNSTGHGTASGLLYAMDSTTYDALAIASAPAFTVAIAGTTPAASVTGKAWVLSLGVAVPHDAGMTLDVTFEVTGVPTFTGFTV